MKKTIGQSKCQPNSIADRRIRELFGVSNRSKLLNLNSGSTAIEQSYIGDAIGISTPREIGAENYKSRTLHTPTSKVVGKTATQTHPSSHEYYYGSSKTKGREKSGDDLLICPPIAVPSDSGKRHFLQFSYRKSTLPTTLSSSKTQLPAQFSDRGLTKDKLKIISGMADGSRIRGKSGAGSKYSFSDAEDSRREGSHPPASKVFSILQDVRSLLGRTQFEWKKPN